MPAPQQLVEGIESGVDLPGGTDERFNGYGVMGLPFASGHVLAMRRFPASSVGPGYTSVWHRDRDGRWAMYQNVDPQQACPRYFGSAVSEASVRDIEITWTGPRDFSITVAGDGGIAWQVSLAATPATRLMNAVGGLIPDALWRNGALLRLMGAVASVALGAGKLGLAGRAPNGQQFIANPRLIWSIPASSAAVDGRDLGPVGPLASQASLGDFLIPQRGIFVIGCAFFEPFDEARHSAATSQATGA